MLYFTDHSASNSTSNSLNLKLSVFVIAGLALGLGIGAIAEVAKQSLGSERKKGKKMCCFLTIDSCFCIQYRANIQEVLQ